MNNSEAGRISGKVREKMAARRRNATVTLYGMGFHPKEIAKKLQVSLRTIWYDLEKADEEGLLQVVDTAVQDEPITMQDIHLRLSEMFDADIGDIFNEDGKFKPIHEWPRVWRQMLSGTEVKELFERSKDGGNSSWDQVGELVRMKFADPLKIMELAGRLRPVDAFPMPGEKLGEGLQDMAAVMEKQLMEGRRRAALAERNEEPVIDAEVIIPNREKSSVDNG